MVSDLGGLGDLGSFGGAFVATAAGPVFVRRAVADRVRAGGGPDALDAESQPGEPAVFVHGLGGESLDWADVAQRLADRVDAYALDLPGFGESPMPADGDMSLDAQARRVADVIRALGRGPVHLIGNSLGGAVATLVAAEHADVVRSLALVSPALPDLRPRVATSQLLLALVPVLGARTLRRALHKDPEWMARQVFAFCYGDPDAVTEAQWAAEMAAIARRAALPYSPAVYRASLWALVFAYLQPGRRRLWRQAARVGVPTLLIYGGKDRLVDARLAARAGKTFPHAHTVLMPDAGHVAHLEFPERVAATMREFLDGALGRGMSGPRGTVEGSVGRRFDGGAR